MSLMDPLTCGFLKVFVYHITVRDKLKHERQLRKSNIDKSTVYKELYELMLKTFSEFDFKEFPLSSFIKSISKNKDQFEKLGKKSPDEKLTVLQKFSNYEWIMLLNRHKHSFSDCQGCLQDFKEVLSYFPINKANRSAKRKAALYFGPLETETKSKTIGKQQKEELLTAFKTNVEEQWKETSILRLLIYNI